MFQALSFWGVSFFCGIKIYSLPRKSTAGFWNENKALSIKKIREYLIF
jgi:hypothetical protein